MAALVLRRHAVFLVSLSIFAAVWTPTAGADVASNLNRAATAAVGPLSRAIRSPAALSSSRLHLRHPLSLDVPRSMMLKSPDVATSASIDQERRFSASFPIHWQREEPQIFRTARAFKRQGLPLVHLWQSDSGEHMLSLGLNSKGVPGIWLTQKVPD